MPRGELHESKSSVRKRTEWLEVVLAGSKMVYLYSPDGERTRIDVYGEFTSPTLPPEEVEAAAREFLETEFAADAPIIRAEYRRSKAAPR